MRNDYANIKANEKLQQTRINAFVKRSIGRPRKIVKLLEKVMKDKKEVDSSYLDGFKSATAIVRYFYHMEKEVTE